VVAFFPGDVQRGAGNAYAVLAGKHRCAAFSQRLSLAAEWAQIAKSLGTLADTKIFLDDTPGIGAGDACQGAPAGCRTEATRSDHRRLFAVDVRLSKAFRIRQQEVSLISRELKGLAKELNVPLVALSQLSRAPESRSDHRPQLSICASRVRSNRTLTLSLFFIARKPTNLLKSDRACLKTRRTLPSLSSPSNAMAQPVP